MGAADELCFTPATVLRERIRTREVSPVEVVRAVLDRIERVNPQINAFTVVVADEAMAAARRAEEAVTRGGEIGSLHGIPFTLKDLTPTKGIKTMYGSRAFADYVPVENSVVADRLVAAGGILIGKTTTPEFGNKGITESMVSGTTNNPWKTTHVTGGSSGGAAACVAAGIGPIAEGSDGGGSIRIPASCCGVVGLKASVGRVPSYPKASVFESLSHQGPITRTVADAALMLNAIAGPDDRFPYSLPADGTDYLKALEGASVKGLRVAYSRDLGLGPVDPQVIACTDAAAKAFAGQLGARVDEAAPELPNVLQTMLDMWSTTEAATLEDLILTKVGREDVDPALLALADRAAKMSAVDYYRAANFARTDIYQRIIRFFNDYDLLITPTIAIAPFAHPGKAPGPSEIAGQKINPALGWLLTYPFNLTGQPAISVPCGFSDEGLPIGLQIVGRRHADMAVLRAAAAYEQAAPWADKRPSLD